MNIHLCVGHIEKSYIENHVLCNLKNVFLLLVVSY